LCLLVNRPPAPLPGKQYKLRVEYIILTLVVVVVARCAIPIIVDFVALCAVAIIVDFVARRAVAINVVSSSPGAIVVVVVSRRNRHSRRIPSCRCLSHHGHCHRCHRHRRRAIPIILDFIARRAITIDVVVIVARCHRHRCHHCPSPLLSLSYPIARCALAVGIIGNSMARDDEERCKRDGNVGAAGGWSDKGQRGIKT
jgi:hypothetical protein